MACPSGLHTGLVSLAGSAVRRTGAPPSLASTVQMSLRRRFASRSSVLTVNASREWALELASSDSRSIATRSCTVKPVGAAKAAVPAAITREMTRPRRMRRISLGMDRVSYSGLYCDRAVCSEVQVGRAREVDD